MRLVGNGSVRKKRGHWQVTLSYLDDSGERRQRSWMTDLVAYEGTNRNRKKALALLEEKRTELLGEQERQATGDVVSEVEKMCDYRYRAGIITYATWENYRYALKHIARGFSGVAAGSITPEAVRTWLSDSLAAGEGAVAMKKAKRLLSSYFEQQILDGALTYNPCRAVETPKPREEPPNPLEPALIGRLNSLLAQMEDCCAKRAATISLNTGTRVGEDCALTWRRIDFERRLVEIYENYGLVAGRYERKDTKGHARRCAPMTLPLYVQLREWRRRDVETLAEFGIADAENAVMDRPVIQPDPIAGPPNPSTVSRTFSGIAKGAGLVGVNGSTIVFHGLRHTYATQWIAHGGDVKALAHILGHKDASITLNVYAAADPMAERRGVALLSPCLARGWGISPTSEAAREFLGDEAPSVEAEIDADTWSRVEAIAAARGVESERVLKNALGIGLASLECMG